MTIHTCELPDSSLLDRRWVEQAYFQDAYRTSLTRPDASVVDIFFAVFGHHPPWMKRVLIARNRVAVWFGLDAATPAEILDPAIKGQYAVGDKIGPWPIFALTDCELVAGRNNKHLDFRLSVIRQTHSQTTCTVISTICSTHNTAGKVYLLFIVPFHKWGVKWLMRRAIDAGRL